MGAPQTPDLKLQPPFEIVFSPELKVRYGYRDAHVELEAKVPYLPLGRFKKSFTQEEFQLGKKAFDQARMWKDVPEFQRRRDAPTSPFVVALDDRVAMHYGFADAHAELIITIIEEPENPSGFKAKLLGALTKKLPKEIRHTFTAEEIESGQSAFAKADLWSKLPDDQRRQIGA